MSRVPSSSPNATAAVASGALPRSISLDLKDPADRETLLALAQRADVLIEGLRPGVTERLGIGPADCRARNPRLVYARMTGWGQHGPLADRAGHDINYIAVSGVLHLQTADPLRTPTYTLFPMPDYFFGTTGPNVSINSSFAWNHGYYSPNIDITWAGVVGPGVAANGVNGPAPTGGNEAQDPNSTHTVPEASQVGTWV